MQQLSLWFTLDALQYVLQHDKVRSLFTAIGFPAGGSGPYTCTQKGRTVIHIRRNNTNHRTHKIESKAYKTIKQK
jgi:hypothetical protein